MNNKKRILSLLLALLMMCTSFSAFSTAAYAANKTKYYDQKIQYNSQSASCNFDSKHYVEAQYNDKTNKEIMYVYSSMGGKIKKKISVPKDGTVTGLVVKEKYIYFSINTSKNDGELYRVGLDGKGKKRIIKGNESFIIAKNKIIYGVTDRKNRKVTIYSTNMNGKSKKKIGTTNEHCKYFTYGDNLYFISGKKLCSYNLKKNKKKMYSADKNLSSYKFLSMQGKTIYLGKQKGYDGEYDMRSTFYKMDLSKKKVKKIIGQKRMYGKTALVYSNTAYEIDGMSYGQFIKVTNKKKVTNDNYWCLVHSQAFYKNYVIANIFDDNLNDLGYKKFSKID